VAIFFLRFMSPEAQMEGERESNMCLHSEKEKKRGKCLTADLVELFIGQLGSSSKSCDRQLVLVEIRRRIVEAGAQTTQVVLETVPVE
jgi:hypothetical protein